MATGFKRAPSSRAYRPTGISNYRPSDMMGQVLGALVNGAVDEAVEKALASDKGNMNKKGEDQQHKAWMSNPYDYVSSQGLWRERPSRIVWETLRSISYRNPIISGIISTRVAMIAAFSQPARLREASGNPPLGYRIISKHPGKKMTEGEKKFAEKLEDFIWSCGMEPPGTVYDRDNFDTWLRKTIRDSLTFDACVTEIVPTRDGKIYEFHPVDAATIRLSKIKQEVDDEEEDSAFVQVVNGQIVARFAADEMMYGIRNPVSDIRNNGYGVSEIEQLISVVTNLFNAITHNCIAGDTEIWTEEHGAASIEEVLGGNETAPIIVWTGKEWADGIAFKTGEKKLCRTELSNGIGVGTSPDHRFRVIGEEGAPIWKTQSDLVDGDYVLVNKKNVSSGCKPLPYKNIEVSADLMEVLGWMVGDGNINKGDKRSGLVRLFYHHEKEKWILQRHLKILNDFGINAKPYRKSISVEEQERIKSRYGFKSCSCERIGINIGDADFVRWLISSGFYDVENKAKLVPNWLLIASVEHKSAFLRGLFSADGTNNRGRSPSLTITSDILRQRVKMLLLSMGIRTHLNEGKVKIIIKGADRGLVKAKSLLGIKDRDLFFELIGFLQSHKQPKELKVSARGGKSNGVSPYTVKLFTGIILEKIEKVHDKTHDLAVKKGIVVALNKGVQRCSLNLLFRYMDMFGVDKPDWLQDYYFERIVKIDRTEQLVPMYDVSVKTDLHQFISSGICCHNSMFFKNGAAVKGLLNIKKGGAAGAQYGDAQIESFKRAWNAMVTGQTNAWKTPIIQSEGVEFINMGSTNREMEFLKYLEFLVKLTCSVFLIEPLRNWLLHDGRRWWSGIHVRGESGGEASGRERQRSAAAPVSS